MDNVPCWRCRVSFQHDLFTQRVSTGVIDDPAASWWQFWRKAVCPVCNGSGKVSVERPPPPMPPQRVASTPLGGGMMAVACPDCLKQVKDFVNITLGFAARAKTHERHDMTEETNAENSLDGNGSRQEPVVMQDDVQFKLRKCSCWGDPSFFVMNGNGVRCGCCQDRTEVHARLRPAIREWNLRHQMMPWSEIKYRTVRMISP